MVRMNVKDFIITGSQKDVDQYTNYLQKMESFLAEAKVEIQKPERAKLVTLITNHVGEYEENFQKVIQMRAKRDQMVNDILSPKGLEMRQDLTRIMTSAFRDKDPEAAYYSGRLQEHLLLARLYVMKFLDANDTQSVERVHKEFKELEKLHATLEKKLQNSKRKAQLASFFEAKAIYLSTFDQLTGLIFERNDIIKNHLDRIGPVIAKAAEDVKLSVKSDQDKLGPAVQEMAESTLYNTVAVAIGSLITSLLLAVFLSRAIGALNNLMINLVNDLFGSAEQVASAAFEISSSSQSLSQGASEQASSLEETSATMEQIASQSKHNASNSKSGASMVSQLAELVSQSSAKAVEAKKLSTTAKIESENGVQSISKIAQAMQDIRTSSDKITDIIEVINEITHQTKMLATNAAIEAARAGEQGKGFAVVADEVSKLAESSKSSAKEISSLIKESSQMATKGDQLSQEGVTVLQGIFKNSETVAELIDEVSNFSHEQADMMTEVKNVVDGITAASNEQAYGVDQVSLALVEMDKVTQSNAATSEETASSSEELNAQADALRTLISDVGKHFGIHKDANSPKKNPRTTTAIEAIPHHPQEKAMSPTASIPMRDDFNNF